MPFGLSQEMDKDRRKGGRNLEGKHKKNRTEIIINHEFTGTKTLTEVFVPVIIRELSKELRNNDIIDKTDSNGIN